MATLFDARQFVESFCGGDPVAAIDLIAEAHGVAVAQYGREDFEATLGREMDEEEWQAVTEMDEFAQLPDLLGAVATESLIQWRLQVLAAAGINDE